MTDPCCSVCREIGGPHGVPINKGVTVEREGRRRFAVVSNGHRWGHFLLRRDAEQFADDVRHGRALFSEPGQRLIQRKGQS